MTVLTYSISCYSPLLPSVPPSSVCYLTEQKIAIRQQFSPLWSMDEVFEGRPQFSLSLISSTASQSTAFMILSFIYLCHILWHILWHVCHTPLCLSYSFIYSFLWTEIGSPSLLIPFWFIAGVVIDPTIYIHFTLPIAPFRVTVGGGVQICNVVFIQKCACSSSPLCPIYQNAVASASTCGVGLRGHGLIGSHWLVNNLYVFA